MEAMGIFIWICACQPTRLVSPFSGSRNSDGCVVGSESSPWPHDGVGPVAGPEIMIAAAARLSHPFGMDTVAFLPDVLGRLSRTVFLADFFVAG